MFKQYKKKLIIIAVIVTLLTFVQFVLPEHSRVVGWYNDYIFRPFQIFRNAIFSLIPFSVGDFLYVIGVILLAGTIVKWVYYAIGIGKYKRQLVTSFIQSIIVTGVVYIIFLLGWGGNYYKSSLSEYWHLPPNDKFSNDTVLISFDKFLIDRLNNTAGSYRDLPFKEIDNRAKDFYERYTSHSSHAVKVKPSIFGNVMQYMRIQGYYNPFTGEAQVNRNLPSFMLPFVISHEMAHQQGIAREDDANLLAYALGTQTNDVAFQYSSYFNIWLYTHRRLKAKDSVLANYLKGELNTTTLGHIDELIALREKYDSDFSEYSGTIYDGYLKLHHQNEGIRSYNKVWHSAWALEQKRKLEKTERILVP